MSTSSSTSPLSIPSMTIENGRLSAATWIASPNSNARPAAISIDTIVIHNISLPPNEFGAGDANGMHYVKALFTNQLTGMPTLIFRLLRAQKFQRISLLNVMALSLSL